MKNQLIDLQNILFEQMEYLKDRDIKGADLTEEINRSMAIDQLARTAVANGALMAKCADILYGLPVSDQLPLIPASPSDTPKILSSKRDNLIDIPKRKM
jgi:hypothetical protein